MRDMWTRHKPKLRLERFEVHAVLGPLARIVTRRDAYLATDFQQRVGEVADMVETMAANVAFID
jgi:hypothetical protein